VNGPVRFLRNRVAALVLGGIVVGLILSWALLEYKWLPTPAATQANRTDDLITGITYVSGAIFCLVMAVMLYCIWKFRRRDEFDMRDGAPVHGHTGLEIFWTAIPTVIVTVFGVWAGVVLHDNEAHATDAPRVLVTGFQYGWSFTYKSEGGFQTTQMVLPEGRTTVIETTSTDVIHDFFVPAWRLKIDAVPGITASFVVTPDKTGEFKVYCAELCGPGHATMGLTSAPVKVVSASDYAAWLAQQKQSSATASPGAKVFATSHCGGCHTFTPANATGKVGPDLDNLASDAQKAISAGKATSVEDYTKTSIDDPNAYIVPGFAPNVMPAQGGAKLTPQQVDALVQYLVSGGKK
jgi:cytochrome c oxidase subunit 2